MDVFEKKWLNCPHTSELLVWEFTNSLSSWILIFFDSLEFELGPHPCAVIASCTPLSNTC